jgi:hypothetical protein
MLCVMNINEKENNYSLIPAIVLPEKNKFLYFN